MEKISRQMRKLEDGNRRTWGLPLHCGTNPESEKLQSQFQRDNAKERNKRLVFAFGFGATLDRDRQCREDIRNEKSEEDKTR